MGRNVEWTERYLATLPKDLAESPLAATALTLAAGLDNARNSLTSQSMAANAHRDLLRELRELAPVERKEDEVDALAARRARRLRLAGGAAAKDLPVS